jgi:hypothetical protein
MTWEGVEGEGQPSPRLASQQLALATEAPPAQVDPPSGWKSARSSGQDLATLTGTRDTDSA